LRRYGAWIFCKIFAVWSKIANILNALIRLKGVIVWAICNEFIRLQIYSHICPLTPERLHHFE